MIERKFITTFPEVMGYDIVESKGVIAASSGFGMEKLFKDLTKKAEKDGCNAIVNLKMFTSYGGAIMAYGEGVVVKEKPFNY